jgi:hypothetical protein
MTTPFRQSGLLIQYIRSDGAYVDAMHSVRNPRLEHAILTGTHLTGFECSINIVTS